MTEYTLELEAQPVQERRGAVVERMVTGLAGALLLVWSWVWLPPMVAGIRTQTELGQNGWAHMPSAHQAFEVLFVAAHWGVRWLPGVVLLGLLVAVTRHLTRRHQS